LGLIQPQQQPPQTNNSTDAQAILAELGTLNTRFDKAGDLEGRLQVLEDRKEEIQDKNFDSRISVLESEMVRCKSDIEKLND